MVPVANFPQDLPMKSLWKNQKIVEETGAPWRGTASTGPIPQCMCAGTVIQVCPEQTTVQLLRYGCHKHTCGPPTHLHPQTLMCWLLGRGPVRQLPPPPPPPSSPKCYLLSHKDNQSSSRWDLPNSPQVCSNFPFWVHDYSTYRMISACTHLAS